MNGGKARKWRGERKVRSLQELGPKRVRTVLFGFVDSLGFHAIINIIHSMFSIFTSLAY